jgi:hypothetical protein
VCLSCFAAWCQALAYYCIRPQAGMESSPSALALPPPSPPPEPSASEVAGITEPHHPRIPKLLHQSWRDGGFPKTLFNWRWQQGLLDLNPEWRLMKWTDETSRALIAEHYSWFLPTYDAYPSYIQRCDASRYFIVYHHGGVYADLDIECSKPFAPVLGAHRAVFSYKQGRNLSRGLVNALFATERHHPLWEHVFALLSNRSALGAAASTHVDVIFSTGPGLLREAIMMLQSRRELHDLGIELLDASVWHPVMPEQKRGRDPSASAAAAIANSHCYHHFVSSWMAHDKDRHDSTEQHRHGGGGGTGGTGAGAKADDGDAGERAGRSRGGSTGAVATAGAVPVGQGIRTRNLWKSFALGASATTAADDARIRADGQMPAAGGGHTGLGHPRRAVTKKSEKAAPARGTATKKNNGGTRGRKREQS